VENREYDYIFNSNKIRQQSLDVTSTTKGSIDSLTILDSGKNYKVNDKVIFDTTGTEGRNVNWKVSKVKGKPVDNVSLATTFFDEVEFTSSTINTRFVGLTSQPHNFLIKRYGFYLTVFSFVFLKNFTSGSYNIGVSSSRWYTSLGIPTDTVTGIVTFIYVSGLLNPSTISSNDIVRIEGEKFKVLNIDTNSNRLRVIRGYDNTLSVAHSAGTLVRDDPRKIIFTAASISTTKYLPTNKEYYFAPNESLGIGTNSVGSATTITFSNPGVGITQIILDQQQVYFPDHDLELNTPMIYYTNGGTSIQCWSGVTSTSIF